MVLRVCFVFDPQGPTIAKWNYMLLAISLASLFIDPLFLFSPHTTQHLCVTHDASFDFLLCIFRSLSDIVYFLNILLHFRTAYSAPSSRVLGRGELVIDSSKIALKYLSRDYWIHVLAALPIPQIVIGVLTPEVDDSINKASLRYFIVLQYLLRLVLVFVLTSEISKTSGAMPRTAWSGATFTIILYYLTSHVVGACWYLLALQKQEECWRSQCQKENPSCKFAFFNCDTVNDPVRNVWFETTNVTIVCDPNEGTFHFGIYQIALQVGAPSSSLLQKYWYTFWWGFQTLSSIGNNLSTSSNVIENIFTNLTAVVGLVLFALFMGNLQRYFQSLTSRLEEQRSKRADIEQWMHQRQLPNELKQWIRKYDQYKWVATRGVDDKAIVNDLPTNLRRKINRHMCFNLFKKVPVFDQLEDNILDEISDRIKTALCIENAILFSEGDPVTKMVFIIRGRIDSYTTNGGQTGPGNWCGEELLTWALDPNQKSGFPTSTRTVKAITEVEAFFLAPNDLKYVATQFRKLHTNKVVHTFRYHSLHWRTWAASYIQLAWRRYKTHKEFSTTFGLLDQHDTDLDDIYVPRPVSGFAQCSSRVRRSIRRGSSNRFGPDSTVFTLL